MAASAKSVAQQIRELLPTLGGIGYKFKSAAIQSHFSKKQGRSVQMALINMTNSGELGVVQRTHFRGVSYINEYVVLAQKIKPIKEKAVKKAAEKPAWADAWPDVYKGLMERRSG